MGGGGEVWTAQRRDLGEKLTLTAFRGRASWAPARVPLSAFAAIDSKIKGVQIGAITYKLPRPSRVPNDIIKAYQTRSASARWS